MKICLCELSGEYGIGKKPSDFCEMCDIHKYPDSLPDLFSYYAKYTSNSAVYPKSTHQSVEGLNYCVLKLVSEAGEVAGKLGKFINKDEVSAAEFNEIVFNSKSRYPNRDKLKDDLILELGDLLWYVFETARQLNTPIEEVMLRNIKKLEGRKQRGTIIGDGDDR